MMRVASAAIVCGLLLACRSPMPSDSPLSEAELALHRARLHGAPLGVARLDASRGIVTTPADVEHVLYPNNSTREPGAIRSARVPVADNEPLGTTPASGSESQSTAHSAPATPSRPSDE